MASNAKQQLFIDYICSDVDLYLLTNAILEPSYFDPEFKKPVEFIKHYYDEYKATPTQEQIYAETGNRPNITKLTDQEADYAIDEIEKFCKNKAIQQAVLSAPKLLELEDYGTLESNIKEAVTVGLTKSIGLSYFDNVKERLERLMNSGATIATLWNEVDDIITNGGVGRKELILFLANSGVGKSLFMANLAANFIRQGLNGIYITLELSEDIVAKRMDSMFSGIQQSDILKYHDKVAESVESCKDSMGDLTIVRMSESTTTSNMVRAYLKEYEIIKGFKPDFVVVDYLDLMASNNKIGAENMFIKDKYVAEELRSIANDLNLIMVSASQLGRSAIGSDDIDQADIQGGISKINTCDLALAIIQSETLKAQGEFLMRAIKCRNSDGTGKYASLKFDPITMTVGNMDGSVSDKPMINMLKNKQNSILTQVTTSEVDQTESLISGTKELPKVEANTESTIEPKTNPKPGFDIEDLMQI